VIGVSMIVLAGLLHLPVRLVVTLGVAMIALHNTLDRFRVAGWQGLKSPMPGFGAKLWMLAHQPFQVFPVLPVLSPVVVVVYPLIPWIGVMAVGFGFGSLYQMDASRRRRWLLMIGGIATLLFVALRAINIYGDPSKWSWQSSGSFTVLSFLNTTKYPPSLLYLLMTLGPAILALAWFEKDKSLLASLRKVFVTFGRVPLFFYLLQWYMAHLVAIVVGLIARQPVGFQFLSPIDRFTGPPLVGVGFRLWVVYVCWAIGVVLLYPLCKWFAGVKARRKDWWLSYL